MTAVGAEDSVLRGVQKRISYGSLVEPEAHRQTPSHLPIGPKRPAANNPRPCRVPSLTAVPSRPSYGAGFKDGRGA